ncbi:HlyD family secretion protein [Alkanindiges illinoisensis]|uniref:HlyD family secretion protein n=1 Tax=Alkanindiges illinoisensis TaxID=197183 RepID=UPI0009FBACDA|nr:HlyD family secretion protein [Alkanindiges illinoisensis]
MSQPNTPPSSSQQPNHATNLPENNAATNPEDPLENIEVPTDAANPNQPSSAQPQLSEEQEAAQPEQQKPPKIIKPKKTTVAIMAVVLLIGVGIILWSWKLWPFNSAMQTTNNSYIRGQTTILSSQVNGYVTSVRVKDFDEVKKGQVLMTIDATTYAQNVAQAQANVEQTRNSLANVEQTIAQRQADINAAQARVAQAQSQYELAQTNFARINQLVGEGAVSLAERDRARAEVKNNLANLKQAQANLQVAQGSLKSTQVGRSGMEAQIRAAQAQLEKTLIDQQHTDIIAPRDGQLGEVNTRLGQYVAAGSQLLYLIPDQLWLVANYKETQIERMQVGQPVSFKVDALGHQKFTGHVDKIAPATGSEFSVLKSDNASGNFTKVVQRIAVRIAIDPNQQRLEQLRPGMSVITTVDTRNAH